MRPSYLRSYRVSLADSGAHAVWVTADSAHAASELAERVLNENRSAFSQRDRAFLDVEILDEYEEGEPAAEAT
jgi:hypothetical protein